MLQTFPYILKLGWPASEAQGDCWQLAACPRQVRTIQEGQAEEEVHQVFSARGASWEAQAAKLEAWESWAAKPLKNRDSLCVYRGLNSWTSFG